MTRLVRMLAMAFAVSAVALPAGAQAPYKISSPLGSEAFRTGVEAYHRGRYAESLLLFERTLSDAPNDPLTLYWLGKAYLKMGLSATALSQWRIALSNADSAPFIESRIESEAAAFDPLAGSAPARYVRVDELAGVLGKDRRFLRPTWLEPLPDGSAWLVAHGTNQLLRVSANGQIVQRLNAGSTGFDRPFGMAILDDGTMFVSEFQANRIARLSPDGAVLGYSGESSGPGRLAGPQYLCADGDGFVYVSDVGFARVVKYGRDGGFVASFGTKGPLFGGLRLPTGIATDKGRVYVADAALKSILVFDSYGNYLGALAEGKLSRPEGLRISGRGLLVADTRRILLVDPETDAVTELYRAESAAARMVSAAFDANGDLLVADFDSSELLYLADPTVRFAGLSVDVLRVYSDSFPRVRLDVRVLDRFGMPLVGLTSSNFYLSESVRVTERRLEGGKTVDYMFDTVRPAVDFSLEGALSDTRQADVCLLVEGSPAMASRKTEIRDLVTRLFGDFGADASFRLVGAGASAQPAISGGLGPLSSAVLSLKGEAAWSFDAGLRLAAGSLFGQSGRRAVVYLSTGSVNEDLLKGSSVSELGDLLRANGIAFYAVILGREPAAPTLDYLAKRSGGLVIRADRPEGTVEIAARLRAAPMGVYRLSFTASAYDGFGLAYLPVAIEVYMRDRSGRDETGYFAPLR